LGRRTVLVFLIVCAGLAVAGCGAGKRGDASREVVAAFYPLAYAAEQVGAGDVVNLTQAGAEPHDLELTAGQIRQVREARLVVYLGRGFQPALEDALAQRTGPALDLLARQSLLGAGASGGDPHVWLDPVRYAAMARELAAALGDAGAADPLLRRLDALDADLSAGLRTCARRELVTGHAAFGYFAHRYGLRQVPLTGLSPEAEPSPRDVARLAAEVRRTGATTVFSETLLSPRLAETVARETGARTAVLDPLEGLTADELNTGADYFSVMRQNLATLREALGCA